MKKAGKVSEVSPSAVFWFWWLREIYFKKSASEARQKSFLDAEQAVQFFGIGLPIVHQSAVLFFADCGQQKLA